MCKISNTTVVRESPLGDTEDWGKQEPESLQKSASEENWVEGRDRHFTF